MNQTPRPGGGPRTRQGKRASSANALKHGLTAATLLPVVVGSGRLEELRLEFLLEYAPRSATERHLVDELARHAAMLEVSERAEGAVLRQGGLEVVPFLENAELAEDALLTAATTSERLERFTRYRRAHEKGFTTALGLLQQLRLAAASACQSVPPSSTS